MKELLVLFCTVLLFSCSNEKEVMLNTYDTIFEAYCSGNFERVYEYLDQPSKKLITRLITNETPDSLLQIGKDYGLPYLSVMKYVYFDTNNDDPMLAYSGFIWYSMIGLNSIEK